MRFDVDGAGVDPELGGGDDGGEHGRNVRIDTDRIDVPTIDR